MRGMKRHVWLFVLALVMIMVSSSVQAQSSRILFSSDQGPSTDRDIWKINDDGSSRARLTSETGDTHRPSMCDGGQRVVYDNGDELFLMKSDGTEQETIDVVGTVCDGGECKDADCGKVLINGNLQIVFTREYVETDDRYDIILATVDISKDPPKLITLKTLLEDVDHPDISKDHHTPTWCGSRHIVWSRVGGAPYDQKVCVIPITCANTPPTGLGCAGDECWNPAATDESHPSCNQVADRVAFDREHEVTLVPGEVATREICTLELDTDTLTLSNEKCYTNDDDPLDLYDDTAPSWSPSGTQIIFASDRAPEGPDYELWAIDSTDPDPLNVAVPLTENSTMEVDDEPDWGPLALP